MEITRHDPFGLGELPPPRPAEEVELDDPPAAESGAETDPKIGYV